MADENVASTADVILKMIQVLELSDNYTCFLLPIVRLPLNRGLRSEREPSPLRLSSEKRLQPLRQSWGSSKADAPSPLASTANLVKLCRGSAEEPGGSGSVEVSLG